MAIYSQAKGTIRPDFKNFKKESKKSREWQKKAQRKKKNNEFFNKRKTVQKENWRRIRK